MTLDPLIKAEFDKLNLRFDVHTEKLDEVLTTVYGCDGAHVLGMKTRVDRLEQAEGRRGAWLKWVSGLLVVIIGERIKSYFKGP